MFDKIPAITALDTRVNKRLAEYIKKVISNDQCNCFQCRQGRLTNIVDTLVLDTPDSDFMPIICDTYDEYFRYYKFGEVDRALAELAVKVYLNEVLKLKPTKVYTKRCDECGIYHKLNDVTYVRHAHDNKHRTVCHNCMKNYHHCKSCNSVTFKSNPYFNLYDTPDGKLCNDCFEKSFNVCQCCTITTRKADTINLALDPDMLTNNAGRQNNEYFVCKNCVANHIHTCASCHGKVADYSGRKMYSVHLKKTEKASRVCGDCYSLLSKTVQNYNFKPNRFPNLVGKIEKSSKRADFLRFGVEIETEPISREVSQSYSRDYFARDLLDAVGRNLVMIKHDGSVEQGLELVSFPFTWQWLKENKELWSNVYKMIGEKGYSCVNGITGNAGFHVHMTKSAFTTFHLYKFLRFMYLLENRGFIMLLSGRQKNWHYADFDNRDSGSGVKVTSKTKVNVSRNRHSAISLMYSPTVEVRIFGGVDTYALFMKNLEFCFSMYEFTKDATPKQLTAEEYLKFIINRKNSNRFSHLVEFLKSSKKFRGVSFKHLYKIVKGVK